MWTLPSIRRGSLTPLLTTGPRLKTQGSRFKVQGSRFKVQGLEQARLSLVSCTLGLVPCILYLVPGISIMAQDQEALMPLPRNLSLLIPAGLLVLGTGAPFAQDYPS